MTMKITIQCKTCKSTHNPIEVVAEDGLDHTLPMTPCPFCLTDAVKRGIREYSWWKDGTQYVGSTGKTLKQALDELDQRINFMKNLKQKGKII